MRKHESEAGMQADKSGSGVALVIRAAHFAADRHRHQTRKGADKSPYINHPIALADVLAGEAGITDPAVLCAALLHDTIEDTQTTADELRAEFGNEITDIVLELTDDKTLPKERRKELQIEHAPYISPKAKLVKLADKICNLRDIAGSPPADWSRERRVEYFDWAARVVAGLRGTHPPLEAAFDKALAMRGQIDQAADRRNLPVYTHMDIITP